MFETSHTKKYIFISSVLINFLLIALILLPKGKEISAPATNESQEKTAEVIVTPNPTVAGLSEELPLVKKVIDGDTIVLDNGETVRYIGIDTPELYQGKECFGQESTAKNRVLVEGKTVRLEKDVSERDKYGRLLRYAYIGDLFINEYLVREGYAKVSTYPPDVKYQQVFLQAEREAFEANKGLWGNVCFSPTPKSIKEKVQTSGSCKYSCDSPDKDCVDFSTQAEAQEFFDCCGFNAENDPMKLDSTQVDDGIPCESLP